MHVLVAYASRSGATAEIAARIADRIRRAGNETDCVSVTERPLVTAYDAFVVGSAVYLGQWEKEAIAFVDANRAALAANRTWFFSSGPLGTEQRTDAGEDKIDSAVSQTRLQALSQAVDPRGHRVFFGALDPDRLGVGPRLMRMLPAGRRLLEEGDFRDWAAIEAWADEIADQLADTRVPVA
jgi:menaquinone-dependent protoporphyrinogen oxidase